MGRGDFLPLREYQGQGPDSYISLVGFKDGRIFISCLSTGIQSKSYINVVKECQFFFFFFRILDKPN